MIFNFENLETIVNRPFLPLLLVKDRYLILWGGAGSGKSYFTAEKLLLRILKGISKGIVHKFLCLRKTQRAVRQSVFALLLAYRRWWGLEKICIPNITNMSLNFCDGSSIICGGLDDPDKIKSIFGLTTIWLEEATEFNLKDFTQLDLRLRGITPDYKQIILTFNPVDENNWIKARFFDKEIADAYFHHSTYKDNRYLDAKYIEVLEDLVNQDINYYNIYALGKWGVLTGLIFSQWSETADFPEAEDCDDIGFGLDFGYSNNPSALIEVRFKGNDLFAREWIYEKNLTNPDICQRFKDLYGEELPATLVADSAEPKSITEINQAGYNCIPCFKGKDSIVHGIQRIKQYNLHVHESSVNLMKELRAYKWQEDKDGNIINKPVDFMNHAVDALRYIVTGLKGMPSADVLSIDAEEVKPEEAIHERYQVIETPKKKEHEPDDEPFEDIFDEALWQNV